MSDYKLTKGRIMSDEYINNNKLRVWHSPFDKQYYVVELTKNGWCTLSKGYRHSTSCYAKLGRIVHRNNFKGGVPTAPHYQVAD